MIENSAPTRVRVSRGRDFAASTQQPKHPISVSPGTALPSFTLNDLLWAFYLYPVRFILGFLPGTCLEWLGTLAEPVVQWHERKQREQAAAAILRACSQYKRDQAARIARQSITNLMCRTLDDLLLLRPQAAERLRCIDLEGIEHLDRAIATGKGVLLLSGHFFANRIAARCLATLGYPVLSFNSRSPENPKQGRFGSRLLRPREGELTRRGNPDVVYFEDPECTLTILQRLRSSGIVRMALDSPPGLNFVEHPFLGCTRRFPLGLFELVRISGCAVVPMIPIGRSAEFRILFEPQLEIAKAFSCRAFVELNIANFTGVLERQIRDHPEEWAFWGNL